MSQILKDIQSSEYPVYGIVMYQKMDRLEMLVVPAKIETEQELRDMTESQDSRETDVVALYPDSGNISKMLDFYRYAKDFGCSITIPPNADDPWSRIVSIPALFGNPKMFWENYLRLTRGDYQSIKKAHRDDYGDFK